jgi:hypothetical protein
MVRGGAYEESMFTRPTVMMVDPESTKRSVPYCTRVTWCSYGVSS